MSVNFPLLNSLYLHNLADRKCLEMFSSDDSSMINSVLQQQIMFCHHNSDDGSVINSVQQQQIMFCHNSSVINSM